MKIESIEGKRVHSFMDSINYDTCKIVLRLLQKLEDAELVGDNEKIDYMVATHLMRQLKHEALVNEINIVKSIKERGYLTNEQVIVYMESREEIQGTMLGKSLLED